jgi:hypothetical protein
MHETGLDALRNKPQKPAVIKRLRKILPQNTRRRQSQLLPRLSPEIKAG